MDRWKQHGAGRTNPWMHVDTVSVPVEAAPTGATNAVVIAGDERLLVDPADTTAALDAEVTDGVDHLAVTHTHPDHTGGVAAYADRTDATVWARRGYADRFERVTGVTPDRTFVEGDRIGPARVLDTGGHAPDHVAFETPHGTACGDLAIAEGSVAVTYPEGSVRAYLTALRRLYHRDSPALFPGHGPVIDDPRAVCARLIAHRLDRERRVRDAVAAGATDTPSVTDTAYDKPIAHVRELAEGTVRAHLDSLDRAGHVVWNRDTDRVRPPDDE